MLRIANARAARALLAPAFFAAFVLLAGPARAQIPGMNFAQPVQVVTAQVKPVDVTLQSVGSVQAIDQTVITAQATGTITEIHFHDNEFVKSGQLLATLDTTDQVAALQLAQAQLAGARRDLDRAENLARSDAAPRQQVDDLRTEYESDLAKLATARADLDKRYIRAPYGGVLGLRDVSLGALVTPGTEITSIRSTGAVDVQFSIPEQYVSQVRVGQTVHATAADTTQSVNAVVRTINSHIDPTTLSATVIARSVGPAPSVLPGTFVNVSLVTARRRSVVLPEQSIYVEGAHAYAYVVKDNKAMRHEVKVGERNYGTVEILSGIAAGDSVISSGIQKVREGAPVRPIVAESSAPRQQEQ